MAVRAASSILTGDTHMHRLLLAAAAVVSAAMAPLAFGQAAPAVSALDDAIKPIRVSGLGIKVADLERSKKFYTEVLGLKVDARVPATGEAVEYLLGMTGN